MDLSLVLPGTGRFDGPAFSGKSHVPALILGVLESCVVVLQDNLGEDAVPAPSFWLWTETGQRFDWSTVQCALYTAFVFPQIETMKVVI